MEKTIIEIRDEDLFVGTWDLSKGLGVEHRALKRLINRYKTEFESFGVVTTRLQQLETKKGTKAEGRKTEQFMLTEPMACYLTTLLTNNERVREFKMKLTRQFYAQRKLLMKLLAQRHNQDWIERREAGKVERRLETDSIKAFIEYSKLQGSKNAQKYYMILSKMENQSLLNIELLKQEFDNLRDIIDIFSLSALQIADVVVATALNEGMKIGMFYKDIYILARDRVEALALSMGKTPLRLALKN